MFTFRQGLFLAAEPRDGDLVLRAAEPWSPANHHLFPVWARARAVELLVLGRHLSQEPRFDMSAGALSDIWFGRVMPRSLSHHNKQPTTTEVQKFVGKRLIKSL